MRKVIAIIALSLFLSSFALADEKIQLAAAIGSSSTRLETGATTSTADAVSKDEKGKAGATEKEAVDSGFIDTLVYGALVGIGLLAAAR
ncbi:MAG: hypothetical protein GXP17_09140 [Gammaproteobacteria bacterium]|nr:hypothetical protein [Gammaproteobacteria bacterium]